MKRIFTVPKVNVCKGDVVVVLRGDDKGKKGVVRSVFPKRMKLVVDGVNVCKRAVKRTSENNANFINVEHPIHISMVKVVEKKHSSGSRGKLDVRKDNNKHVSSRRDHKN